MLFSFDKVSDVEAAIKGLVAGTLKPEDVKVEGIDTEEEKLEKEVSLDYFIRICSIFITLLLLFLERVASASRASQSAGREGKEAEGGAQEGGA
jgi:hypothetical protein